MSEVVSVTKKGQATIPKRFRDRHAIGRKVLAVDTAEGVLLKPIPDPFDEKGSLKAMFKGKSSKELIEEARHQEFQNERNRKKVLRLEEN
jgi:bifunctional DNA-binding transcriptional regulator/antitoxin component of YhaV-PrlF toxin-antitoxin module